MTRRREIHHDMEQAKLARRVKLANLAITQERLEAIRAAHKRAKDKKPKEIPSHP